MANVVRIFNQLVEDRHIVINTGNFKAHNGLRIRLVKLFSRHKNMLEDIGFDDGSSVLSLCASWNATSGHSTFHIQRRKQSVTLDFEIVKPNG